MYYALDLKSAYINTTNKRDYLVVRKNKTVSQVHLFTHHDIYQRGGRREREREMEREREREREREQVRQKGAQRYTSR